MFDPAIFDPDVFDTGTTTGTGGRLSLSDTPRFRIALTDVERMEVAVNDS